MKKFSIALSPGHTPKNQGASRGNITEYLLSSAIIGDLIMKIGKVGHIPYLIGSDINKVQVDNINIINPDFGLELHFNANVDKKVNGSMCLHSGGSAGQSLGFEVVEHMTGLLHTKFLGNRVGNYQLDKRKPIIEIIKNTSCPFIVVEPLYLSNDSDFEKIDIQLISTAIFEGILSYWEVVG